MPLIDLKTNLKSLGYGNDRPDGGSSNQPYIVTPIPDEEALRTLAPDFLLRNGYLNAINSLDDADRIGKWFIDLKSPSGLLFTAKQQLLERQNPKLVNINRVYNPLSTVLQAGFLSTGLHLNKQGVNPYEESYYSGGTYGYFSATRGFGEYPSFQTLSNGDIENRLTIAYTAKIAKQGLGNLTINPFGILRASGDNVLLSYTGGPGSILGIGLTNIRIQNPTQTKKSNWSYEKTLEEEVSPSNISFKPVYISSTPDLKGYLTPSIKRPSIDWQYDFFLDNSTVSSQFLKLYPTDENYNTLYIFGSETNTTSTKGGNPSNNNVSNNDKINSPSGISGFTYDPNNNNVKTYLTPFNKHPYINWTYDFFTDRSTVSALALSTLDFKNTASKDEAFNTLFIYGAAEETNSTPGGTLDVNIANNENLDKNNNVGVNGRFTYDYNITSGPYKYLTPFGGNVPAIFKYGVSNQYVTETQPILNDNDETNKIGLELQLSLNNENIARNEDITLTNPSTDPNNNVYTFSYKQTLNTLPQPGNNKSTALVAIQDFRKTLVDESNGNIKSLPSTDYINFNREKTYRTSTTNFRGNYISSSYQLDPNTSISPELINAATDNDLIDFYFSIYNAADTSNIVIFKAYLEDWSDSYKGEWNGIKYMGRAEQLYKYNGFSRNGNLTFNVPVLSKGDLATAYTRLNQLINTVAPFYSTGTSSGVTGLMTGVITKITMGDYWKSMPILINSVNYAPITDMGWDIGRTIGGGRELNSQLPKGIKVSLDFNIIHNYTPQYGKNFIVN